MGGEQTRRRFLRLSLMGGLSATSVPLWAHLLSGCGSGGGDAPSLADEAFQRVMRRREMAWEDLFEHYRSKVLPPLLEVPFREEIGYLAKMYENTLKASHTVAQALTRWEHLPEDLDEEAYARRLEALALEQEEAQTLLKEAWEAMDSFRTRIPEISPALSRKSAALFEAGVDAALQELPIPLTPEMTEILTRITGEVTRMIETRGLSGLFELAERLFVENTDPTPPNQESPLLIERMLEGMWHYFLVTINTVCGKIRYPLPQNICVNVIYILFQIIAMNVFIGFLPTIFLTGILSTDGWTEEEILFLNIVWIINAIVFTIIVILQFQEIIEDKNYGNGAYEGIGDIFGGN
ncbi:MAG: hypothetical protein D6812_16485 [Deltaproteobacteria bacterium]|nr:MAG: hypothetical protein D6812_16485 [Deltaproteobacteria bacterium]